MQSFAFGRRGVELIQILEFAVLTEALLVDRHATLEAGLLAPVAIQRVHTNHTWTGFRSWLWCVGQIDNGVADAWLPLLQTLSPLQHGDDSPRFLHPSECNALLFDGHRFRTKTLSAHPIPRDGTQQAEQFASRHHRQLTNGKVCECMDRWDGRPHRVMKSGDLVAADAGASSHVCVEEMREGQRGRVCSIEIW